MLLYLVRHGLAAWPASSSNDHERPLTMEGVQQMQAVGAALASRGVQPDLILHSPLLRARKTAELIAQALDRLDDLRESAALQPGFDARALGTLVRRHAAAGELMLVGHAPDMPAAVHALTEASLVFKEGTVACVKLDQPDEALKGALLWLAPPTILTGH